MQNKNTERLIIVQNPNSTLADEIDQRVFAPLDRNDIPYEIYHTESADTEENIAAMRQSLPEKSTVVGAAGDGTAMQLINTVMRDRKDITLGFVPLGNFNDIARTHAGHSQTILDIINAPTMAHRPLKIELDGEYWRHAPAYLTLGWTALAASEFGGAQSREAMQETPRPLKLVKSLGQLAGNYFENRHTKLPPFRINDDTDRYEYSTDVLAINSPRVGSIVRSPEEHYLGAHFGMRADIDVSRILPNIPFGLRAIAGQTPLDRAKHMRVVFDQVSAIPAQTEGEFQWIEAKEIFVYKNPHDVLRILHPKRLAHR